MPLEAMQKQEWERDARAALGNRTLVPLVEARHALGGIGHSTLYNLIDSHALTRVSIGRRAFITLDSLIIYLRTIGAASVPEAK
jgi:hypothetical protein